VPQAATAQVPTRKLAIVARNYQFPGIPPILPAANYDTRFVNIARDEPHEVVVFNLGAACASLSRQQVIALLDQSEEAFRAACPALAFEGFAFAPPLGLDRQTLRLAPGRTMFVCFIPTPQGVPHFKLGMLALSNVIAVG